MNQAASHRTFPLLPDADLDDVHPTRANQLDAADRPVHAWYRFVLAFPPHLVRAYATRFRLNGGRRVLDPFCGTGTTLVECKKLGIPSIGVEAHPMAHFAGQVKTDWRPDPDALAAHAEQIAHRTLAVLAAQGMADEPLFNPPSPRTPPNVLTLPDEQMRLLLTNSISPRPLHKTLLLLDMLKQHADPRWTRHEMLALAKALVCTIGNLHFGPEVGVGRPKADAPVVASWLENVHQMCRDLRGLPRDGAPASVLLGDSRRLSDLIEPHSIDAVITSPPYPNEKDYTRTTRLESVLLGLIRDQSDLQALKRGLIRSNTRGVSVEDDDDQWVAEHPEIQRLATAIESRRVALGKTSGFERLYARVTKLYFGGMFRHLAELRNLLRPGAQLAYVVGDQASYLRVMIRTGRILGQIAESLGYQLQGVDLFRTRTATATKEQLREEVVVLMWPGKTSGSKSPVCRREAGMANPNRYERIIQRIFDQKFRPGDVEVAFSRDDVIAAAKDLAIELPKNLGDVIYSFRYRVALPPDVNAKAPEGGEWVIRPAGRSQYRFVVVPAGSARITPDMSRTVIKVPDATPGLISRYALNDEQSLLAKIRYNRLIDVFTGVACHSLQSHLRTTVPGIGQVETDEIYIGVDRRGVQYVFPVQAKGRNGHISPIQIEQDVALCKDKFPQLVCRPIGAKFVDDARIALFHFDVGKDGVRQIAEKHYRLVAPDDISEGDLEAYRNLPDA